MLTFERGTILEIRGRGNKDYIGPGRPPGGNHPLEAEAVMPYDLFPLGVIPLVGVRAVIFQDGIYLAGQYGVMTGLFFGKSTNPFQ